MTQQGRRGRPNTLREVSADELRGLPPWLRIKPLQEGLGPGFVIDAGRLILTNAHVVEDADVVHVRTPNGEDVDAEVVGRDPEDDLALLRAVGISSRPAVLGDSDRIEVGDWVVAIGNPLGLHHTVTAGIISAKARGSSGCDRRVTGSTFTTSHPAGPPTKRACMRATCCWGFLPVLPSTPATCTPSCGSSREERVMLQVLRDDRRIELPVTNGASPSSEVKRQVRRRLDYQKYDRRAQTVLAV